MDKKYKIYLIYDEHITNGHDGCANIKLEPYKFVRQPPPWCSKEICIEFDPSNYNELTLVVARYTTIIIDDFVDTGETIRDSICITHGSWHIIGVYQDPEDADEVVKFIDHKTYAGYKPWTGYFESFESVDVFTLPIEERESDNSRTPS